MASSDELAGFHGGLDLGRRAGGFLEVFLGDFQQGVDGRGGEFAGTVGGGGKAEGVDAFLRLAGGGELVDFPGRGDFDRSGFRQRGFGGRRGGGACQIDVLADEPRVFGGDLRACGLFHDAGAGAFENLLDGEAGGLQVFEQFAGVEAVGAVAVLGGVSGVGGEGDERSGGWFHFREAAAGGGIAGARIAGQRGVAAGVEDDEIAARTGGAHFGDDLFGVEELGFREHAERQVIGAFGLIAGFDRDEVVGTGDRDAVTGVVEQGDFRVLDFSAESATASSSSSRVTLCSSMTVKPRPRRVLETALASLTELRSGPMAAFVFRVADDEGDAGFGWRFRGHGISASRIRWRKIANRRRLNMDDFCSPVPAGSIRMALW